MLQFDLEQEVRYDPCVRGTRTVMVDQTVRGEIRNTGAMDDFAAAGPWLAEDPSRLRRVSGPSLLSWLAFTRGTGTLVVHAPGEAPGAGGREGPFAHEDHDLALKDGNILAIEQRGVPFLESVLVQLVGSGTISAEAAARAQATARETGQSLLQVLYDQGACTPRDLVDAIRSTKQGALERLMSLPTASFAFTRTDRAPRSSDPVAIDLNLFVIRFIRERTRTAHLVDIEPLLAPLMGRFPIKTDRLTPAIAGVGFTDKERKTLTEVADGSITLKEVFSLSLLGRVGTARLFLTAGMLGFVEYRMSPLPKGGIEVFEAELKKTLERVQSEDYFTRLGIHWTTHPSKIEPAFRRMEEKYGPLSSNRRQSERSAQLAAAIHALMEESFRVLSDRDQRRSYRAKLLGHSKLEFGTEFLYKQALLARFRGELDKAREIIESAMDILPKPEFEKFRRGLSK